MEYLSIKNLEKYQPSYKDNRRLLWIRWDIAAMRDYKISQLPDQAKWLFLALICVAIENKNHFPNDEKWIKQQIGSAGNHIPKSLLMLQTLELVCRSSLQTSEVNFQNPLRTIHNNTIHNNTKSTSVPATLEDFIQTLKTNPVYSYINIDLELGKMDAWLLANPTRKKTKRFIVNWLNRIEKPLPVKINDFAAEQEKKEREKFLQMKKEAEENPITDEQRQQLKNIVAGIGSV